MEKGEEEKGARDRKQIGWIGMPIPRSRAGRPVSRPLPAATDM